MNQTCQIVYKPDWCKHYQLSEVLEQCLEEHVNKEVSLNNGLMTTEEIIKKYILTIKISFIDRKNDIEKVVVDLGKVVFKGQVKDSILEVYPSFIPNEDRALKFIFTNEDRPNGMITHPEQYVNIFKEEFAKVSRIEGGLINPTSLQTIFKDKETLIREATKVRLFKVWNLLPSITVTDSVDSLYPSFTNLKPTEQNDQSLIPVILEADYDVKVQTFISDLLKNNVYCLLKTSDLKLQLFIKPGNVNLKNLIISRYVPMQSFLDVLKDFAKSNNLEISGTHAPNFTGVLKDSSDQTYLNFGISFKQKEMDLSFTNINQYNTVEDMVQDLSNHYDTLTRLKSQQHFDYIDKALTNITHLSFDEFRLLQEATK